MAVVANPLVVRIFINSTLTSRENGWAERWPIWETDWNAGLDVALKLVQARQNVLSSNAYIQWGCLGTVAPPYYEQTVTPETLAPLPQWGPAAFDMQGVLFSLTTFYGENAPRLFRAVEGTSISAKRWAYADMPIPSFPPALPADLTTAPKDLLWQNTLATFRQYASTQQPMSDGHHGPGVGYWVEPYVQIVYRQVSSRRVGLPWQPMSWEAYPYANAPQFSPCGCVVTVNRHSYAIPCRFGRGWSLRGIHYYFAKLGATVMTFKTPFCCWMRSKEDDDFTGVGEAEKYKMSDWQRGNPFGNAPGVMWTGPQSYFEGNAPEPPMPTPAFMLPACDKPVIILTSSRTRQDLREIASSIRTPIKRGAAGSLPHFYLAGKRQEDSVRFTEHHASIGSRNRGQGQRSALAAVPSLFVGSRFRERGRGVPRPLQPPENLSLPGALRRAAIVPSLLSIGSFGTMGANPPVSSTTVTWVNQPFLIAHSTTAGSTLRAVVAATGTTCQTPAGWTLIRTATPHAGFMVYTFEWVNAPSQATTTFTLNSPGGINAAVVEVMGAGPAPDDQSAAASGSGASIASGVTGMTTQAPEMGIAMCAFAPSGGPVIVNYLNGYSQVYQGIGITPCVAIGSKQLLTLQTTQAQFSVSNALFWDATVQTYHG